MSQHKRKKNTGKEFEGLTARVYEYLTAQEQYTQVERDVYLDSPEGLRQFDVVLRSKVADLELVTVIECRDFKKNLTIAHVDGLYSKMLDVQANKAVLVARKGFSNKARKKAKRLGITLCTVHNLERDLVNVGLQIPVIYIDYYRVSTAVEFYTTVSSLKRLDEQSKIFIDDLPVTPFVQRAIIDGVLQLDTPDVTVTWQPLGNYASSAYISGKQRDKIPIEELSINYTLFGNYFFGYVHDLPNTIAFNNVSMDTKKIFYKPSDIVFDYEKHLTRYKNWDQIPQVRGIHLTMCNIPRLIYDEHKKSNLSVRFPR